jgi:hypothetical protein
VRLARIARSSKTRLAKFLALILQSFAIELAAAELPLAQRVQYPESVVRDPG